MARQRFKVQIECEVEIAVEEAVLARGSDPEWGSNFYGPMTVVAMAQHLAFNAVVNGRRLSQLDGFADMEDDAVVVSEPVWEYWGRWIE